MGRASPSPLGPRHSQIPQPCPVWNPLQQGHSVLWSQAVPAGMILKPFTHTGNPKHPPSPSFYSGASRRLNVTLILKTITRNLTSDSAPAAARGRVAQPDLIWGCSDLLGLQNWVGVLRRTGSHNNCGLLSFLIGLTILWEQLSQRFHIPGLKLSTFFLMNTLFVGLETLFPSLKYYEIL